jgi:hypothetical protein
LKCNENFQKLLRRGDGPATGAAALVADVVDVWGTRGPLLTGVKLGRDRTLLVCLVSALPADLLILRLTAGNLDAHFNELLQGNSLKKNVIFENLIGT